MKWNGIARLTINRFTIREGCTLLLMVAASLMARAQDAPSPNPVDALLGAIEKLASDPASLATALEAVRDRLSEAAEAEKRSADTAAALRDRQATADNLDLEIEQLHQQLADAESRRQVLAEEIASLTAKTEDAAARQRGLEQLLAVLSALEAPKDAVVANQAPPEETPLPAAEQSPVETAAAQPIDPALQDFFETSVRPTLAQHCFGCHGPEKQKSGLRVDSLNALLHGGDSGPAVVPGNAEGSRLVQVIRYAGDLKMPPDAKLSEDAIQALTQWVTMGAPWPGSDGGGAPLATGSIESQIAAARENHWAFRPIARPNPPEPSNPDLAPSPVDRFIQARLAAEGIASSPKADRRTLLRRLHFDLVGLPPTSAEVEAFAADSAPDAYERAVDKLLDSPHYGERWARYWLDLARYSDTKGYVFEQERAFPFSHTFRDYVIRAFNEDLPYDTFIKHQLAADLMNLGEDKRPLAAMGFLTLGRRFIENIHDITDDRIDVLTRGLLGLTVSCARCHDHKFDPISMEDYYALYGIFRSSSEPGELPLIEEPNPEDPKFQEFQKEVSSREADVHNFLDGLHVGLLTHAREHAADYMLAVYDAREIAEDEPFKTLARDRKLLWQMLERWRDFLKKNAEGHDPVFAPWHAFAAISSEEFEILAPKVLREITGGGNPEKRINAEIAEVFKGAEPKSMSDVAARYREAFGVIEKQWKDMLAARTQQAQRDGGAVQIPTSLPKESAEELRMALYGPGVITNIPAADIEFMSEVPERQHANRLRQTVARVHATHPGRPDRAMALQDAPQPFEPYVFKRGKPENQGDSVPRRFLAVLSDGEPRPFEKGSGRLELAEAIASKDNPLTARVFVNRLWMYHFGKPIVETTSDFGLRSDPPTNPELLDFLAAEFIASGWSVKKMHRMIVTSHAYQQSSANAAEACAKDPENRLFWRQNRRRLDFEAARDALLVASGRIDLSIGGESVDITEPPFPPRRTVYSRVERQNLPSMFRTFDFASPDTHSPRRFQTTVPQQALFMMNSPFVIEQARALAARPEIHEGDALDERIRSLYEIVHQREPDSNELALAQAFLSQTAAQSPIESPWAYGYGDFDPFVGTTQTFTPFPHFSENSYRGGTKLPDDELGWVNLNAGGGHPGKPGMAAIRRWVSPITGQVTIKGKLSHGAYQGDGVAAFIASSRHGLLWAGAAHNNAVESVARKIAVEVGDAVDFIVSCVSNEGYDSFTWAPVILERSGELETARKWEAEKQFDAPPPAPLEPLEQYAQVLLLTNEFMFLD